MARRQSSRRTSAASRPTAAGRTTAAAAEEPLIELTVGAPAHGGHCIARPDEDPHGPVIFVRHALPGERVRARITRRTSKMWEADAVEILSSSPDRVQPYWPEAGPGGVGGGELSHVSLPAQRTWKRWVLADCMARIGGPHVAEQARACAAGAAAVEVEELPADSPAHAAGAVRTRIELSVAAGSRERGEPVIGMHPPRSLQVRPLRALPLAVPQLQDLALTQARRWRRLVSPGSRITAVAPRDGEPLVLIDGQAFTAAGKPTSRRRVREYVDASPVGLGRLDYTVSADGFWQVHHRAADFLVERVIRAAVGGKAQRSDSASGSHSASGSPSARDAADAASAPTRLADEARGLRVLELYSGAGLFTLPLAMLGAQVTTLEGNEQAVRDARRTLHGYEQVHLHTGAVTAESIRELCAQAQPDVIVADPPRVGAGADVMAALTESGARRIVLVSCDPAACARDCRHAVEAGYTMTSMAAADLFPHTHHFETIVVLSAPTAQ